MNFDDRGGPDAEPPLDSLDVELLSELSHCWDALDPMPAGLVDEVRLAIDLEALDGLDGFDGMEGIDADVLLMTELAALAGSRGDEQSRMITFESESFTITVSMRENDDGTLRLDGWLSPPGAHRVELRCVCGPVVVAADQGGRFLLDEVAHGPAQFVVRPVGRSSVVRTHRMEL